jgi:hypothetical protein
MPRPIGGMLRELFGELFEFDSKVWRTARLLLLKPGALTVDYHEGRRRRQVRPVKLYLFVSAVYFLFFAFLNPFEAQVDAAFDSASRGYEVGAAEDGAQPPPGEQGAPEVLQDAGLALGRQIGRAIPRAPEDRRSALRDAIRAAEEEAGRPLAGGEILEIMLEQQGITREEAESEIMSGLNKWMPVMMIVFIPLIALVQFVLYQREFPHFETHVVFMVHYYVLVYLVGIVLSPLNLLAPLLMTGLTMVITLSYYGVALRRFYGGPWREFAWKLPIMILSMLALSCCSGVGLWFVAVAEFILGRMM